MKTMVQRVQFVVILVLLAFLGGCTPSAELPEAEPQLATARVSAEITEQPGQARITAHNNLTYFVHAEPAANTLDEIDTLLAAQATCAVFVAEKAAQELDIPLKSATATTQYDQGEKQVYVYLDLPATNDEQILELANHMRQRCPIYTTLSEAASIEFTPGEQFEETAGERATVSAELFQFGSANVTAQDITFVMDSVPPLDGPNEELNPLDMMLGGMAACSRFIYEREAPTANVKVVVEGDFDPSGVRNLDGPNPRIQDMRILLEVDAYDETEAARVENLIQEQCELYKLLNGTVTIVMSTTAAQ